MNRPITNMEITTVIKSLPTKKTQGQISSQVNSAENLEKNNAQTLPENFRERKTPKLILQSHHQPDIKQDKDVTKKKVTDQYH